MKPFWSGFRGEAVAAFRRVAGVCEAVMDEYARFVPATGAGDGFDWACCAAALALRRASSMRLICSGVGGFAGSFPAERVARGGVFARSDMLSG